MLKPNASPIEPRAEKQIEILKTINFGEAYVTRMDQDERKATVRKFRAVRVLEDLFAEAEEMRRFLSPISLGSLNGWGKLENAPARLHIAITPVDVLELRWLMLFVDVASQSFTVAPRDEAKRQEGGEMSWVRIERPTVTRQQIMQAAAAHQAAPPGKVDDFDAYMQRLVQLIPAEIVALYLTFHGLADPKGSFALGWPIICLGLVIIVRILGTHDPGFSILMFWKCQWIAVGVAAVSYVLWIYAIGDTIWGFTVRKPIWISASIAIWTIFVPYFYKG